MQNINGLGESYCIDGPIGSASMVFYNFQYAVASESSVSYLYRKPSNAILSLEFIQNEREPHETMVSYSTDTLSMFISKIVSGNIQGL